MKQIFNRMVLAIGLLFAAFMFYGAAHDPWAFAQTIGPPPSSGGGGTVTSVSAGCGSSTGGGAITTSGTISSFEAVNLQTGSNYVIVNGDCGKLVDLSSSSSQTPTIAQAGTGGNFGTGWYADVCSIGTGAQTLTPTTSTINGQSTLVLNQNQCVRVVSDGTNYQLASFTGVPIAANGVATTPGNLIVENGLQVNGNFQFQASGNFQGGVTLNDGSGNNNLSAGAGELAFYKITASSTAPGNKGAKMEFVCGTNSGSVKLIAYGGTSTTPVTIVDNIGSGVTGC